MYTPTDEELDMLRHLKVTTPMFEKFLNKEREDARDLLEKAENPIQRGRAQNLSYLIQLIRRGEPTR